MGTMVSDEARAKHHQFIREGNRGGKHVHLKKGEKKAVTFELKQTDIQHYVEA